MTSPRSTTLTALATACALVLGLLALLGSAPRTARAWPGVRMGGPAFVKPGGTGLYCDQGNPCGSIQYAITSCVPGNGDVIYVAAGVYTGTGEAVLVITKSVELYGGWDGSATGGIVRRPATYPTILDGENARRVVSIEGCVATLDGFTIVRGNATGLTEHCPSDALTPAGCGGGIMAYNASPLIVGNTISGNVAYAGSAFTMSTGYGGGAIIIYGSGAVLSDNVILGNVASNASYGRGGGLDLVETDAHVERNRILSNTAAMLDGAGWGWGGGIAGGPYGAVIADNVIEGNRGRPGGTSSGAGLYQWGGDALYSGNRVRANEGDNAVYLGGSYSRLERNLVVENATSEGIRLHAGAGAEPVLVNNVIAHGGAGAALLMMASEDSPLTATLLCNTLAGSGAASGVSAGPYASLVMTDNIVAGFTLGITATQPASSTVLADHTLFWANGDDGLQGTNPVEGDPAFVGPVTGNYHIRLTSAAFDAGVPVDVADDIDGDPRPKGAGYDIGADERLLLARPAGPAFVRPGGADDLCTRDSPCASIQYAIDLAEPGNGDTIYVAGGVYTGTGAAVITVTKSVTLYAGWNGQSKPPLVRAPALFHTTLDGENARRVVYIGPDSAPTLDGFAIVRGNATGLTDTCPCGWAMAGYGGGILSCEASPLIVGNTISGNVAYAGEGGDSYAYGGGVELIRGSGVLSGNLIQGNVASNSRYGQGGGLHLFQTSARLEGNRILSNTAALVAGGGFGVGRGGGIAADAPEDAAIVGNIIGENRACAGTVAEGAGVYQWAGIALYSGNLLRANEGEAAVDLVSTASRFEGNLVLDNATYSGIGLFSSGLAGPVLANNVVAHGGEGAAVAAEGYEGYPVRATLLCNTLAGSGPAWGVSVGPFATVVLTDNIVTGFALGITATVPASSTVLADHTLFWTNSTDGLRGTHPVDGNPRFLDAAAGDYHIGVTSAAHNAGAPVDLATDIDGDPRPVGAGYDIGADERGWWLGRLPLVLRP